MTSDMIQLQSCVNLDSGNQCAMDRTFVGYLQQFALLLLG